MFPGAVGEAAVLILLIPLSTLDESFKLMLNSGQPFETVNDALQVCPGGFNASSCAMARDGTFSTGSVGGQFIDPVWALDHLLRSGGKSKKDANVAAREAYRQIPEDLKRKALEKLKPRRRSLLHLKALQGMDTSKKFYDPLSGVLPAKVFFEDFAGANQTLEGDEGKDFIVHIKLRNLHEGRGYEWRTLGALTHRLESEDGTLLWESPEMPVTGGCTFSVPEVFPYGQGQRSFGGAASSVRLQWCAIVPEMEVDEADKKIKLRGPTAADKEQQKKISALAESGNELSAPAVGANGRRVYDRAAATTSAAA